MIKSAQRIVVKIGSSTLISSEGQLRSEWLASFVKDVAELSKQGKEIILVSSGAVALGRHKLNVNGKQLKLEEKQAAAACGQADLVEAYQNAFSEHEINVAQILLTFYDSENRQRYLNAKETVKVLLQNRIIPVVNENDTVATAEIRYGDNDRLAARVAQMLDADLLILLSDIDGLYTAEPTSNKDAKFIPVVEKITDAILAMAGDSVTPHGTGGMHTKVLAAKIAVDNGCHTLVCNGNEPNPILGIEQRLHTLFKANQSPLSARKNWIAHHLKVSGELIVDNGAIQALYAGSSLLPVGLLSITGNFSKGDVVMIIDTEGNKLGKGLSRFSSFDLMRIKGLNSNSIQKTLGYIGKFEVIHRDYLVILNTKLGLIET